MKITEKMVPTPYGEIALYRLENKNGAWVELSSLGAGVVGAGVPDKSGNIENVALGYADPADYMADGPCMGKCPGRYANRIAQGFLKINDEVYRLAVNNGPNHLHGGPSGFQNHIWASHKLENGVEFSYISPAGEENYPGEVKVKAIYGWNDDNELTLKFEAESDADTVVNLTNHGYWNLRGADSGNALGHELRIKAERWLPTDSTLIPTGRLEPVKETPMDFREFKQVGRDIKEDFDALKFGKGYDNCWAIDGWQSGKMSEYAVILRDPESGRVLTVDSDQPGVQIYSGNWLSGSPKNRSGRSYEDYDGIAIEMQGFPDAPNESSFPSQLLKQGEKYQRTIRFRFGTM